MSVAVAASRLQPRGVSLPTGLGAAAGAAGAAEGLLAAPASMLVVRGVSTRTGWAGAASPCAEASGISKAVERTVRQRPRRRTMVG